MSYERPPHCRVCGNPTPDGWYHVECITGISWTHGHECVQVAPWAWPKREQLPVGSVWTDEA